MYIYWYIIPLFTNYMSSIVLLCPYYDLNMFLISFCYVLSMIGRNWEKIFAKLKLFTSLTTCRQDYSTECKSVTTGYILPLQTIARLFIVTTILCYIILCYAILGYIIQYYATLFYYTLYYAMLCSDMLSYAMPRLDRLCYDMLCYA